MAWGDRIFTAFIGLIGATWIWQSQSLVYWSEFAPGSGFLPFWLGVILLLLVAIHLVGSLGTVAEAPIEPVDRRPGRVAAIAIGFVACISILEFIGFLVAAILYLAFMIGIVERRSWAETLLVPPLTAIALWLIFKQWLKIPFPVGPWGF